MKRAHSRQISVSLLRSSRNVDQAGVGGEWGQAVRDVFGEYRARPASPQHRAGPPANSATSSGEPASSPAAHPASSSPTRLDGHSSGADQIAASARDDDHDGIGLSILSGSHLELVPEVIEALRHEGATAPVVWKDDADTAFLAPSTDSLPSRACTT